MLDDTFSLSQHITKAYMVILDMYIGLTRFLSPWV